MKSKSLVAWGVLFLAAAVYWITAYPSIDWWDSAEYSTAAATMGVVGAPGSLILTLLGWPIAHLLPGDSPAHRLNLFAGVMAALSATLIYIVVRELAAAARVSDDRAAMTGGVFAALAFAFSPLTWQYAVAFTPYILTVVFTGLIFWTMLRWWRDADTDDGWRWLALLGLLFGLDFSVHRTNALLIPAVVIWVLIRKPSVLRSARTVGRAAGALAAGLCLQLLVIPMARFSHSPINWDAPTTLTRLWNYESLSDKGGAFLLGVFPRKSPFWSSQVTDLGQMLHANLLGFQVGIAIAMVIGFGALIRRNRRLGLAMLAVLAIQAALTVVYFNIPANFFRSLHRHYLPVLVTCALVAGVGVASVVELAFARRRQAGLVLATLLGLVPLAQLAHNWKRADASNRHFADDYARNVLTSLPKSAIHFTVGDNDTFPLMYMQSVEGVRTDVDVVNYSVSVIPGFADQRRRDKPGFPLSMTTEQRRQAPMRQSDYKSADIAVDTTPAEFDLAADTVLPSRISLHPTSLSGGEYLSLGDITMVDILRTNAFRRPVTISTTAGGLGWLQPYARQDGLYWRILPVAGARPDLPRLRQTLNLNLRSYSDPAVQVEGASVNLGFQYLFAFGALARAETDPTSCHQAVARARQLLPPERIGAKADQPCA